MTPSGRKLGQHGQPGNVCVCQMTDRHTVCVYRNCVGKVYVRERKKEKGESLWAKNVCVNMCVFVCVCACLTESDAVCLAG